MKDEGRRDIKENSKLPTFYAIDSSLKKPNKKNKETERDRQFSLLRTLLKKLTPFTVQQHGK